MFTALGHDFVLRRNIRIASAGRRKQPTPFVESLYGSHHTRLSSFTAHLWNTLLVQQKSPGKLKPLPTLPVVESGETFGVVDSAHAAACGGLFEPKKEDENTPLDLSDVDDTTLDSVLQDLGIEPSQLLKIDPGLGQCAPAGGLGNINDVDGIVIDSDLEQVGTVTGEHSSGKRRAGSVSVDDAPVWKKGRMEAETSSQLVCLCPSMLLPRANIREGAKVSVIQRHWTCCSRPSRSPTQCEGNV